MIKKCVKELQFMVNAFSDKLSGSKNPKLKEMGSRVKKIADKLEEKFDLKKNDEKKK